MEIVFERGLRRKAISRGPSSTMFRANFRYECDDVQDRDWQDTLN
jgi:hypothetical protein